jgi:23S rRNA (uracil1939-C5)-methyltransferase
MDEDRDFGIPVVHLGSRGDGITPDGQFVPGAVPGDRLLADGTVQPGPDRVAPACRHFGVCGGCQLQHASEALLRAFASERCLKPLAAVGITPEEVQPVHLSPPGTRRRATLRAARKGNGLALGFSRQGAHELVDLGECPVMHPRLFALGDPLRGLLARILPARGAVSIGLTLADQGIDMQLAELAAGTLADRERLIGFAEAQELARLTRTDPSGLDTLWAPEQPTVTLGGVAVPLPPGGFLQATADGEAALVAAVTAACAGARRIADLFAGLGTFALPLSAFARLHAVEGSGPAIGALGRAARAAGRPVATEHRDLFRRPLTAEELARFDAVVFDPPRAGAMAQSAALAASQVPVIVAVSCNPATFARDAERLAAGGYRLDRLWPVAQFRWSTHVELVAEFRKPGK